MPKLFFSAARPSGPAAPGPLRELYFDDADAFFTYTAQGSGDLSGWFHFEGDWPGGARNRTVSGASFVQPGQNLRLETRRFYTTGTVEEGLVLYFANEGSGPLDVYVDGQLYTRLGGMGHYAGLQSYCYDLRRQGSDGSSGLAYGNGEAPFAEAAFFSAGWHVVTLVKVENIPAGYTSSGDRATYFDGATVYTRDPTFS